MTFSELLTELGRRLVELKGAEGMWDPDERKYALNRAQLEMVRELQLIRATAIRDATLSTATYSLTAATGAGGFGISAFLDFIEPGLLYDDGAQDLPLPRRTLEWLYANRPNWRRDVVGPPELWFPPEGGEVIKDLIQVHPAPAATVTNALRLHHLVKPADMVNDGDQPWNTTAGSTRQFPSLEPFDMGLVWYAAWILFEDDDPRKAQSALQKYGRVISQATGHVFVPEHVDREPIRVASAYRRR